MWKLPEEDDGEQDQGFPFEATAGRGPAEHAGHCAGECAHEGADRMNFFQRRVRGEIDECSQQGECAG